MISKTKAEIQEFIRNVVREDRMCMAVIGVIPVMIAYPFFQKAFIAGISLGGVKE